MKFSYHHRKKVALTSLVIAGVTSFVQPVNADTPTIPTLIAFTISPSSVDIASANKTVSIDLVVNNPAGISTIQAHVTFTDDGVNNFALDIPRTDSPLNSSLQTVEFKGTYPIPSLLPAGVYRATAAPIIGLTSTGAPGFSTAAFTPTSSSTVVGATNALLVRSSGYLNFAYATFTGPAFNKAIASRFVNPKYATVTAPIWKVGESINPSDHYELNVPTLALKVKAMTPTVCTSDGKLVNFIAVGDCEFIVYTDKTLDYQYNQDVEVVKISAARTKPTIVTGTVATQSSAILPLSIPGPFVFGVDGVITPISATPTVCYPVGIYISIISGGTCTLNYSSPATADYLASDPTPLTFEITRAAQSINFSLPATVSLAKKSLALSASASSGAAVSFQTQTPNVCSVTGNSLNLLRQGNCQVQALQGGTATIAPASSAQSLMVMGNGLATAKKPAVKKLVCVKNGKIKTFIGQKCPQGYISKK